MINFITEKDIKPPLFYFEIPLYKESFDIGLINIVAELEFTEHIDNKNSKINFFSIKDISDIYIFDSNSKFYINIDFFLDDIFSIKIVEYIKKYIYINFDEYDKLE